MNPEEKQLLQKTHNLAEENNKILRHIRRSNRWSAAFRILYWILIIGAAVGAFIYIEPYIDAISQAYGGFKTDLGSIKSITEKIPGLGN